MEPTISEPMAITEPVVMKNGKKFNRRMLLVIVGTALAAAVISGGITWYVMNNKISDNNTSNSVQINKLQAQINGLKNAGVVSTTESASTSVASVNLTNDQIFQEVSTQFGLKRTNLTFFRIWGQDRVSFPDQTHEGLDFAYKLAGKWYLVSTGNGFPECSSLTGVPESYKPACLTATDSIRTTSQEAYMNSEFSMANYPMSTAVIYIGS